MLVFIIYREKHLYSGTLVSNKDTGKKKSSVKERENGGGMVRQESWIKLRMHRRQLRKRYHS